MGKNGAFLIVLIISFPIMAFTVRAEWYNTAYNYGLNYTISNFKASVTGAMMRVNASLLASPCGTERIIDGTGANVSFYRNGCNLTATGNILYFLTLPASDPINMTYLTGNLTPMPDASICDSSTSVGCDNEAFNGWSERDGGGVPTMSTQAVKVKEGNVGFVANNAGAWHQWYRDFNLSAAGIVPTRTLWNIWGYNGTTAPWLAMAKSDDTAYCLAFRSSAGGQLQNYAWVNIAGMILDSDNWNAITIDFDASGKYNLTIDNITGSFSANTLSMASTTAANCWYVEVGADSGVDVVGDTMAVFNYSNTAFAYNMTFEINATYTPPPVYPVAKPVVVCFKSKPICVDISDYTFYINAKENIKWLT